MMKGKHTENALKDTIKRKEQEIIDIKKECAEQFKKIADFANKNDLGNKEAKIRRMAEIAKDNFNLLLDDLIDYKIIELPTTAKCK